ncbi:hypothetical protein [Photorhabdus viridis]
METIHFRIDEETKRLAMQTANPQIFQHVGYHNARMRNNSLSH